ncbi:MAG: hypothetical protein Q9219_007362 [cf. Caloplaca sp. 3 TL-2023]
MALQINIVEPSGKSAGREGNVAAARLIEITGKELHEVLSVMWTKGTCLEDLNFSGCEYWCVFTKLEISQPGAVNEDDTKAWLLGCPNEASENAVGGFEEYLSDVLPLQLRRFGLLGHDLFLEPPATSDTTRHRRFGLLGNDVFLEALAMEGKSHTPDTPPTSSPSSLAAALAAMFDLPREVKGDSDFRILPMPT